MCFSWKGKSFHSGRFETTEELKAIKIDLHRWETIIEGADKIESVVELQSLVPQGLDRGLPQNEWNIEAWVIIAAGGRKRLKIKKGVYVTPPKDTQSIPPYWAAPYFR